MSDFRFPETKLMIFQSINCKALCFTFFFSIFLFFDIFVLFLLFFLFFFAIFSHFFMFFLIFFRNFFIFLHSFAIFCFLFSKFFLFLNLLQNADEFQVFIVARVEISHQNFQQGNFAAGGKFDAGKFVKIGGGQNFHGNVCRFWHLLHHKTFARGAHKLAGGEIQIYFVERRRAAAGASGAV